MGFEEKEKRRKSPVSILSGVGIEEEAVSLNEEAMIEPKKRGRPKVKREKKKSYTLTFFPSLYDKASKAACIEGKSVSELIGEFFEKYVEKNKDKIEEYERLYENE